jgi:Tol biopolymer transport system component
VITDSSEVLEANWLPDGRAIAFCSTREAKRKSEIFQVNVDGTGLTNIASHDALNLYFPIFSPDGTQLVVDANAGGEPVILLIDLITHRAKQLAHGMHSALLWQRK